MIYEGVLFILAFFFLSQVSHVSTECDYPMGQEARDAIEDEWAVSQVICRRLSGDFWALN